MSLTKKYYKKVDTVCSQVKKLIGNCQVYNYYQSNSDSKNIGNCSDSTNNKQNSAKIDDKSVKYFGKVESLYLELTSLVSNVPKTIDLKSRKASAVMDSSNSRKKSENEESFLDSLRSYKISILDKDHNNIDKSFIGSFVCSVMDKTQKNAPTSVLLGGLLGAVIGGSIGAAVGLVFENIFKLLILIIDSWFRAYGVPLEYNQSPV